MLNLLFVINSLGSGGAERVSSKLINHYVSQGCNVHVAYLLHDSTFYEVDSKVAIHRFIRKKRRISDYFFWIKSLKKCIKDNQIDVVIAVGYKFGILSAFCAPKKTRVLVKATGDSQMNVFLKALYRLYGHKISRICLQKKEQQQYYPKNVFNKCTIIGNPFTVFDRDMNNGGFESKHIVCIGRVHLESKCHDVAIEAFSLFIETHPGYVLDIYGRCDNPVEKESKEYLLGLIEKKKLQGKVFFHGDVKRIHEAIIPSFACLHTSKKEGMPNAMIEAMLLGIPVISTEWAGADSIIHNGENGFLVKQRDSEAIASVLTSLAEDKSLYDRISYSSSCKDVDKYREETVFGLWDNVVYE